MGIFMKRRILKAIDTMHRGLEERINCIDIRTKSIQDSISSFRQKNFDSDFSSGDTISMPVYSGYTSYSPEERIAALEERIRILEKRIEELEKQSASSPFLSGSSEAEIQFAPLFSNSTCSNESDERAKDQFDASKLAAKLSVIEARWLEIRETLPSVSALVNRNSRDDRLTLDIVLGIQENMELLNFDLSSFGPHGLIFGSNRIYFLSMIFELLTDENKNEYLRFLLCNCTEEDTSILFSKEQYKDYVLYDAKDCNGFQKLIGYLHEEKIRREQLMKETGVNSFEKYCQLALVNHALSPMPYIVFLVSRIHCSSEESDILSHVRQWRSLGLSLIVSSEDKQLSDMVASNSSYQIYIEKHAGILFSRNKEVGFFLPRDMNDQYNE